MKFTLFFLLSLSLSFANSQSCWEAADKTQVEVDTVLPPAEYDEVDSCIMNDSTLLFYQKDGSVYVIHEGKTVQLSNFPQAAGRIKIACNGQNLHVYYHPQRDQAVQFVGYTKTGDEFVEVATQRVSPESLGVEDLAHASGIKDGSVAVYMMSYSHARVAIYKNDVLNVISSSYPSTAVFLTAQILEKSNGNLLLVQSHYESGIQNMYVENLDVPEEKQLILSYTGDGRLDQKSVLFPDDSVVHLYMKKEDTVWGLYIHHGNNVIRIAQSAHEFEEHRVLGSVGNSIIVVYRDIVDNNYVFKYKILDKNFVEKGFKVIDTLVQSYTYLLTGDFTQSSGYVYNKHEDPDDPEGDRSILYSYKFSCLAPTTTTTAPTTTTAAPSDDEGLDVGAIVGISAGAVVVVGGVVWLVMRQGAGPRYNLMTDSSGGRIDI